MGKILQKIFISSVFFIIPLHFPTQTLAKQTYTCSVDGETITNLPRQFFGLFTGAYYFPEDRIKRQEYLKLIKAAGFDSIRLQINWLVVSRQEGNNNWDYIDPIFEDIQNAGLKALPTLIRVPNWAKEDPEKEILLPKHYVHWKQFVKEAVNRYSSRTGSVAKVADNWEIWNEPELSYAGTPKNMVDVLNLAYEVIKENDPQALVFAPPASFRYIRDFFQNNSSLNLPNFFDPIIKEGKFDVINIHLYESVEDKGNNRIGTYTFVKKVKRYLLDNGAAANKHAKLAVTETNDNLYRCEEFNNTSDTERAKLTVNRYLCLASAGADYVYYFMATDKPKETETCEVTYTGLFDNKNNFAPRPAYFALKDMIASLTPTSKAGDLDNDGDIDIFDYGIFVSDFRKTGTPGFVKADLDNNGKVNIFDYKMFYNIFVENLRK